MSENSIPEVDPAIPPRNAVSVYSQDAMDDFPVLKAFQQYIDAEQAKARKRVLSLGIFFGILTGAIIAVFVVLLMNMTMRNQQLNDRLLDFAMKDRDHPPVVVQSAPQSDGSAFVASLAAKIDALQSKIANGLERKPEESARPAQATPPAAAPAKPATTPSAEAAEIERLKALLDAERAKAALESERRRQAELEEYRRKHYPEFYRKQENAADAPRPATKQDAPQATAKRRRAEPEDDEIEKILKETDVDEAISYFDDDEAKPETEAKPKAPARKKPPVQEKAAEPAPAPVAQEPAYSIPVDVKKPSRSWRIPME